MAQPVPIAKAMLEAIARLLNERGIGTFQPPGYSGGPMQFTSAHFDARLTGKSQNEAANPRERIDLVLGPLD